VASGWYPDPYGRHEQRWWDGNAWTAHVSDQGVASVEGVPTPQPVVPTMQLPVPQSLSPAPGSPGSLGSSGSSAAAAWLRPPKVWLLVAAVAAVVVIVVVAAGGSGSSGGGSSGPMTADAFRTRMESLCSDLNDNSVSTGDAADLDAVADNFDVLLGALSSFQSKINDLSPPADLEDDFGDYQRAVRDGIRVIGELRDAARDGDVATLTDIANGQFSEVGTNLQDASDALGLTGCGLDE